MRCAHRSLLTPRDMNQGGRHAQCTDCSRPHKADGGTASASHIPGASNRMEEFVTGMEHRGNRDVNGQESCEFARPAWASSLSSASTRHSGSGTGRGLPCLRWPFTEYLWREANVNGSLTTGPLRDEIPCRVRRSGIAVMAIRNRGREEKKIASAIYTPIGYPSMIVGQKWRIAPRLTHDHAKPTPSPDSRRCFIPERGKCPPRLRPWPDPGRF